VSLPSETLFLLVLVLAVIGLTLWHHARVLAGRNPFTLRPLPGLDLMRRALARGAETGRAIHLSPGSGAVGGRASTAETVAGLLVAERVAAEAALNGAPILVSSGDAVAHLALRGSLRQSYQRAGLGQDYDPVNVQMLAHQDPMAYASGVTTLYGRQKLEVSQFNGSFGQEFLLAGEVGAQRDVPQIAGATTTTALPLVYLTADGVLVGEEIYAAEAYLARTTAPQARLLTQDAMRTAVILVILILLILALFGWTLPI
jgi:hypothetical protein